MTKGILPRLFAVCAVIAPAARAAPVGPRLSLFSPREDLPWHRHDALWQLTGKEWTWDKEKPLTQEAYVIPQRPGKNQVRYFDFRWRDHDFLDYSPMQAFRSPRAIMPHERVTGRRG